MSQTIIYPIITPMCKVAGGTSSGLPSIISAIIGGSGADGGIPPSGGGGGGAGTPIGLLLALTYPS